MIKDSGDRTEFETGAKRDMHTGKGRMDLLPWYGIMEVSKHCEEGALKYGEHNVDKGIPLHSLLDSASRHLAKYMVGTNANEDAKAKATIKSIIKARKEYKGSGSPTFYTTDDVLTDMLLLEDGIGHPLYADEAALARKLRVKEIVTVPRMEGRKGAKGGDLLGIVVNLADYTVGADKGGEVNMFDDFNIDYNQLIYLIETRCSGAMTTPYGAMAIEMDAANSSKA